jgi:hypothetical protein
MEDTTIQPRHIGSFAIRELVDRLPNLKLHVFGHCHEQGGQVQSRTYAIRQPVIPFYGSGAKEGICAPDQKYRQVIFSNAAGCVNMIHLGV